MRAGLPRNDVEIDRWGSVVACISLEIKQIQSLTNELATFKNPPGVQSFRPLTPPPPPKKSIAARKPKAVKNANKRGSRPTSAASGWRKNRISGNVKSSGYGQKKKKKKKKKYKKYSEDPEHADHAELAAMIEREIVSFDGALTFLVVHAQLRGC